MTVELFKLLVVKWIIRNSTCLTMARSSLPTVLRPSVLIMFAKACDVGTFFQSVHCHLLDQLLTQNRLSAGHRHTIMRSWDLETLAGLATFSAEGDTLIQAFLFQCFRRVLSRITDNIDILLAVLQVSDTVLSGSSVIAICDPTVPFQAHNINFYSSFEGWPTVVRYPTGRGGRPCITLLKGLQIDKCHPGVPSAMSSSRHHRVHTWSRSCVVGHRYQSRRWPCSISLSS